MSDVDDESSSASDQREMEWVPYNDRPEWSDVTPIPQGDEGGNVVAIRYTPKFKCCHDYLRAILASGEKSERALELTMDVIMCNPANYTAWKYRRDILLALKKDLSAELRLTGNMLESYPKNYQIWHHRCELLGKHRDPTGEKDIIDGVLEKDAKNYHAWAYRRWLVVEFSLWDGEKKMVMEQLERDVRNNSAWNYLMFLVETMDLGLNPQALQRTVSDEEQIAVRCREVRLAIEKIRIVASNEAAHNYLVGHLIPAKSTPELQRKLLLAVAAEVYAALEGLAPEVAKVWPLQSQLQILDAGLALGCTPSQLGVAAEDDTPDALKRLKNDACIKLAENDEVRRKYWMSLTC